MLALTSACIQLLLVLQALLPLATATPFTFRAGHPRPYVASQTTPALSTAAPTTLALPDAAHARGGQLQQREPCKDDVVENSEAASPPPRPRDGSFAAVGPMPTAASATQQSSEVVATADGAATEEVTTDEEDATKEEGEAAAAAAVAVAAPQTTPAPVIDAEVNADLASEGYTQVTYYSCEAYAATTMCGWHVPVVRVEVSGAAVGGVTAADRRQAILGGALLAVGGLVARWM